MCFLKLKGNVPRNSICLSIISQSIKKETNKPLPPPHPSPQKNQHKQPLAKKPYTKLQSFNHCRELLFKIFPVFCWQYM